MALKVITINIPALYEEYFFKIVNSGEFPSFSETCRFAINTYLSRFERFAMKAKTEILENIKKGDLQFERKS